MGLGDSSWTVMNNNKELFSIIEEREKEVVDRRNSINDSKSQENLGQDSTSGGDSSSSSREDYKLEFVWMNVFRMILLHVFLVQGLYYIFSGRVMLSTMLFGLFLIWATGMGVTAGAHRLFAHRTYKAKRPLQLLLGFVFQMAFQNSLYTWCRDHRLHHKYSDTDADPHNANRGFFFSHVGWLLVRKHPMVKEKGKTIDMSDLEADPVIMFQHKYHIPLGVLFCFLLPPLIPVTFWGESFYAAFLVCSIVRFTLILHNTWLINSAAHMWGMQPYDKNISPRDNKVMGIFAGGEGWHNYHHTFPWDYRTGELGGDRSNITANFIDFFHKIGWAYDLKTASKSMIAHRAERTGDGTWDGKPADSNDDDRSSCNYKVD